MNEYPILLEIARNIRDYQTLLCFKQVSKKCHRIVKHVIEEAPAIFIALIEYETNASQTPLYVFDSLRDLFTELHKYHLENPLTETYNGKTYNIDNYAGPCPACLIEEEQPYDICWCNDTYYSGIKMVKYFHEPRPTIQLHHRYKPILALNSDEGFVLSKVFPIYKNGNTEKNRESLEYLYYGLPFPDELLKLGLKKLRFDRGYIYYPATTDVIEHFELITLGYYDCDDYIKFKSDPGYYEQFPILDTI